MPKSTEKQFSRGSVAIHNKMDDCWIIIHGKVYDVTKFVMAHPGGSVVLISWAGTGRDAGDDFDDA